MTSRPRRRNRTRKSDAEYIGDKYRDIYAIVRRIPKGRVATYGQIAELAGMPGAARVVGAAMRASVPELGLPWQRVVGKKGRGVGRVSIHDPIGAGIQQSMLEAEGVAFTTAGSIRLAEFGWDPAARRRRKAAAARSSANAPRKQKRRTRRRAAR